MEFRKKAHEQEAPGGVRKYRTYTDDFVDSKNQDFQLPDGYVWIHKNPVYRFLAAILYGAILVFIFFYTRLCLHLRIVNRQVFKQCRDTGYFLYGNHTQPVGDVFAPGRYIYPKRGCTIMSPANLGIPVLGKILPMLGGLPIPESLNGMKDFLTAVQYEIERKRCVIIYPESHVWPWCNFVRLYPDTSFRFPVMNQVPAFCMTTTYQKPRHGTKPRITVYLDGPFYPHPELGMKKARKQLHDEVYACMQKRSKNSTYAYIKYEKEEDLSISYSAETEIPKTD